jgi:hypothetical protein
MDLMTGGILLFIVSFSAAVLLAVGFSIAICRGARREQREQAI